jgi:hypothetical protein
MPANSSSLLHIRVMAIASGSNHHVLYDLLNTRGSGLLSPNKVQTIRIFLGCSYRDVLTCDVSLVLFQVAKRESKMSMETWRAELVSTRHSCQSTKGQDWRLGIYDQEEEMTQVGSFFLMCTHVCSVKVIRKSSMMSEVR